MLDKSNKVMYGKCHFFLLEPILRKILGTFTKMPIPEAFSCDLR